MKIKHNSINYSVNTVDDLLTLKGMNENDVTVVTDKDRGGTFVYRSADSSTNNGGTIFNGWTRQYEGVVNVKWFGAKQNIDCVDALIAANNVGVVLIPNGNFITTPIGSNVEKVLLILNSINCIGALKITIPNGKTTLIDQVVINSFSANNIVISGEEVPEISIFSYDGFTGSVKNYHLTYTVNDTTNVAVGDFVIIRGDIVGTGNYPLHAGIWEITNVTGNQITVLNKSQSNQIDNGTTVTGGTVAIIKSVLKFNGCDGFRFEGGQPLGLLDNVCLLGDYNIANSTGTEGTHGIITSSPIVHSGADTNGTFNPLGAVKLGRTFGVSGWGEQGIACSGRTSLVGNFVASCSNRKRGIYSEGADMRMKFSIANGNGEDGFIADAGGVITCSHAIAAGNGLNGFWSTNNSFMGSAYGKAYCNQSDGIEVRGLGRGTIDSGYAVNNVGNGINVSDGGMCDADNATVEKNAGHGICVINGSTVDSDNIISKNNQGYGVYVQNNSTIRTSGGTVTNELATEPNALGDYYSSGGAVAVRVDDSIEPSNSPLPVVAPKFYHSTNGNYWSPILTSIGDLVWKNSIGGNVHIWKNNGTLLPYVDNSASLGNSSLRWKEIYSQDYYAGDNKKGVSGTFTDNNGNTITVTNGIITNLG